MLLTIKDVNMDLEKIYNKWQCTDIEEKYNNNIEPTQFTKSELFSFAEFYHKSKVNNFVLDDVSKSFAKQYAEFCVRCDREGLPLLELDDYIKQYCS